MVATAKKEQSVPSIMIGRDTVAKLLGCSRSHTYNVEKMQGFPQAIIVGETRRWWHEEIVAWLKAQPRVEAVAASRAAPPNEIGLHVVEADHGSLAKEAAADVRSFLKLGKLPNKPNLENMRFLLGYVPLDIRKALHLPDFAAWSDVWAAVTRDKSEPAGRKMIEVDKAAQTKSKTIHDWHQEEFDERERERRANRIADAKAQRSTKGGQK